ncbi:MAG: KH domain-containing protein [Nanoarchaeota archaeon]
METLYFTKINEVRKERLELERKLFVKISLVGKKVTIEGEAFQEYEARLVLEAMQFGFSAKKALLLKSEDFIFRRLPIKNFTRRKDLSVVRGRVIGKEGKTRSALENITGCEIIVKDDAVGLIGSAEGIEEATTALTNLIRGSKQSNIYRFLERMNTARKELRNE